MKRFSPIILLALLLIAAAVLARPRQGGSELASYPPARAERTIPFRVPLPGERCGLSLDEQWQYVQTLFDVDTTLGGWNTYLNAIPVGMDFTHNGRGFLATLHTIFRTTDGGRSWRNMDPYPPPNLRASDYTTLRAPVYLTSLAARHIERDSVRADSILFTTMNAQEDSGAVRLIYYLSGHRLYPQPMLNVPYWLSGAVVSDSTMGIAVAGLDGHLFENDSLWLGVPWEDMSPSKVLIRPGRQDSLTFTDTWVGPMDCFQQFVITVGSHHWVSRDGGDHWMIRPAADSIYDNAVSFCDSTHGITGGGRLTPQPEGWVHMTTNGGLSWTGRVLQTDMPIRAVDMVSPLIAFAAGGNYLAGTGKLWGTTDGGQSWTELLNESAEFKVIKSVRANNAYVDVFAAGVFPDFRGGVWTTRIFLPDTTQAVIIAEPDSLDFGTHAQGDRDTLSVTLRNIGSQSDSITGFVLNTPYFVPVWSAGHFAMAPGQEVELRVALNASAVGEFTGYLRVVTQQRDTTEIICHVAVPTAADPHASLLPDRMQLVVFPNPGNASFVLRYNLTRESHAMLRVFDLSGRLVETLFEGQAAAGEHSQVWNAAAQPSGLYFVRLEAGAERITQKLLLIK
jgi:photosystem II stability/assembly factor-like uncharacterized protein